EDGIRDFHVTGVQTCALPISHADAIKDEYVSTEHILIALAEVRSYAADVLKEAGVKKDDLLQAMMEVRGSHRVTDEDPEGKYERSEERRVGKESRTRRAADDE